MEAAEEDLEQETARTDPAEALDERFEQEEEWRESRSIPVDRSRSPDCVPRSRADDYGTVDDAFDPDILEREDEIDRLTQQIDELDVRREVLAEKNEELAAEVERLRAENADLTETGRATSGPASRRPPRSDASRSRTPGYDSPTLSPAEALAKTNVFVRYHSKSEPTLQAAHGGGGDRSIGGPGESPPRAPHHLR
ncbi:MAG: hypothetical protein U5K37_07465 [Natrialbaceae archaeon]|nr:hypothetical protein [Natrialbaceae archaeon]